MRRFTVALIVILGLVGLWQGCGSGGNGPSGGGKGFGGGSTASYLIYLDAVLGQVNVTNIPASGTMVGVGSPYLAGTQPVNMTTTPDRRFVYVVNSSSGNVNQFAVATDGTLSQPAIAIGTGLAPSAMAIDSTSRFAVVANKGASTLSVYSINSATGFLSSSGTPIALNVSAPKLVTANGNFVFVASANAIDVLTFNSSNGTFTLATGSIIGAPPPFNFVALYAPPQATNRLYALDAASNSIVPYTVSNTGVLTAGAAIPVGTQPAAMIADEANAFLFVSNTGSNNLSVFRVDPATGVLTGAVTPLVSTGTSPGALAFDTVNHFLLVSLAGTTQIQPYLEDTGTGALTLKGTALTATNVPAVMVVAKP